MRGFVAAAALAGCVEPVAAPEIQILEPRLVQRGVQIDIEGVGFCAAEEADPAVCRPFSGSVVFGLELPQVRGVPTTWTPVHIVVGVPDSVPDGPTHVVVTVDGRSSNAVELTVAP